MPLHCAFDRRRLHVSVRQRIAFLPLVSKRFVEINQEAHLRYSSSTARVSQWLAPAAAAVGTAVKFMSVPCFNDRSFIMTKNTGTRIRT